MATMTQEEMDKLLADRGGSALVHGVAGRKRILNPLYDPNNLREGAPQQYIDADVEQWKAPNGHTIQAVHLPDGTWEVSQDEPPAPKPAPTDTSVSSGTPRVPPGSVPRTEGTPIEFGPDGKPTKWDNNQPIRVWHTPDGKLIYEALTPQERIDWEKQKNGGKTDAEVAAANETGSAEVPVNGRPGWVQITRKQGNNTKTTFRGPDNKEVDTLPAEEKSARTPVDGQPGVYLVKTEKGGKSETHFENEAGQVIQAPANTPASIVSGGVTYIRGADGSYAPAKGVPNPNIVKLPPDAPKFDPTNAETAYDSFMQLSKYVNDLVMRGELTPEQGRAALAGPHEQTGMLLDREKERRQTAEGLRRDQLTERSQDMTEAGNRLSFSNNAASTAIRTSSDLIKAAEGGGSTIVPLMVLQAGMGQAMGGFRQAPSVAMESGLLPRVAQQAGAGFTPPAPPNALGLGKGVGTGPPLPTKPALLLPPRPMAPPPPPAAAPTGSAPAAPAAPVLPPPSNAQTTVNQAAPPGSRTSVPSINGATGDATGLPQPPVAVPMEHPGGGRVLSPPVTPPSPVAPAFNGDSSAPPPSPVWPTFNGDGSTGSQSQVMMPSRIMQAYTGAPRNADDLERELISEGYSPQDVRDAKIRAAQRAGFAFA